MKALLCRAFDALRSPARWAVLCRACALGGAVFFVYIADGRFFGSRDSVPARYLPHTILHEFNTDFNEFTDLYKDGVPYYLVKCGESYRSGSPPMAGFLALPVHLAAHLLPNPDTDESLERQEKIAAALIVAASVVLVFLAAREIASGAVPLIVVLVYAFGTSAFSTSAQALWQHGPSQLFLAAAGLALLRGRCTGRFWPLGAILGMAVLSRPTNVVAVLVVGGYILVARRRQFLPYVLAGLPFLVFGAWYNSDYGTVLGPYYSHYHGDPGRWWSSPFWYTLTAHLVSPNRGLLVFSPVMALALAGFWQKVVRERDVAFLCMALIVIGHMVLISKFAVWWAGYSFGPRYSADIMPLAALFLTPVVQRVAQKPKSVLTGVFMLLAVVSVAIHACGVFSDKPYLWNTEPSVDEYPSRLWDWRDGQILSVLHGRRPTTIPFDSLPTDVGIRCRDSAARYGWCRRLDPAGSPATLSFPVSLAPKAYDLTFRARVAGSEQVPGPAGELSVICPGGQVVATVPLPSRPPEGGRYATYRARLTVPGGDGNVPCVCRFSSSGKATVWLDHVTLKGTRRKALETP